MDYSFLYWKSIYKNKWNFTFSGIDFYEITKNSLFKIAINSLDPWDLIGLLKSLSVQYHRASVAKQLILTMAPHLTSMLLSFVPVMTNLTLEFLKVNAISVLTTFFLRVPEPLSLLGGLTSVQRKNWTLPSRLVQGSCVDQSWQQSAHVCRNASKLKTCIHVNQIQSFKGYQSWEGKFWYNPVINNVEIWDGKVNMFLVTDYPGPDLGADLKRMVGFEPGMLDGKFLTPLVDITN